jgi:hypothetical protein
MLQTSPSADGINAGLHRIASSRIEFVAWQELPPMFAPFGGCDKRCWRAAPRSDALKPSA